MAKIPVPERRLSLLTLDERIAEIVRELVPCAQAEPDFPGAVFEDRFLYDPRVDEAWELAA